MYSTAAGAQLGEKRARYRSSWNGPALAPSTSCQVLVVSVSRVSRSATLFCFRFRCPFCLPRAGLIEPSFAANGAHGGSLQLATFFRSSEFFYSLFSHDRSLKYSKI